MRFNNPETLTPKQWEANIKCWWKGVNIFKVQWSRSLSFLPSSVQSRTKTFWAFSSERHGDIHRLSGRIITETYWFVKRNTACHLVFGFYTILPCLCSKFFKLNNFGKLLMLSSFYREIRKKRTLFIYLRALLVFWMQSFWWLDPLPTCFL